MEEWEILYTDQWWAWFDALDTESKALVADALDVLAEKGPQLGRPLVDKVANSNVHNLKELRPGSTGKTELRALFAFDPWRSAILLLGGDISGRWNEWYRRAIPEAEELYQQYLDERKQED